MKLGDRLILPALRRLESGAWFEVSERFGSESFFRQIDIAIDRGLVEEGPAMQAGHSAFRLTPRGMTLVDLAMLISEDRVR